MAKLKTIIGHGHCNHCGRRYVVSRRTGIRAHRATMPGDGDAHNMAFELGRSGIQRVRRLCRGSNTLPADVQTIQRNVAWVMNYRATCVDETPEGV